ncbi:histone H2A, sperm-like [Topomyia yanbarensis]|uniref:histone H2A, sperm-like n=1 Tax=Topomyia yanbarensis TaxID=2498891 RepID=UPI00273AE9BC|nr:histone H2A, sperm-like [Topomyia yanbarensis]
MEVNYFYSMAFERKLNQIQNRESYASAASFVCYTRAGTPASPVVRIHRLPRTSHYAEQVGGRAPVAVEMKYLAAKVLELTLAIRNYEELNESLSGVTISQRGVLPNIQAILMPQKTGKRRRIKVFCVGW